MEAREELLEKMHNAALAFMERQDWGEVLASDNQSLFVKDEDQVRIVLLELIEPGEDFPELSYYKDRRAEIERMAEWWFETMLKRGEIIEGKLQFDAFECKPIAGGGNAIVRYVHDCLN